MKRQLPRLESALAAIIKVVNETGEPIIFATQRGYGDFKGGWEFPGGKIEEGETPQEALRREILEELDFVEWLPADVALIEKVREEMA